MSVIEETRDIILDSSKIFLDFLPNISNHNL